MNVRYRRLRSFVDLCAICGYYFSFSAAQRSIQGPYQATKNTEITKSEGCLIYGLHESCWSRRYHPRASTPVFSKTVGPSGTIMNARL